MKFNPILATDAYKVGHVRQYPPGTQVVYSNLTARGSRVEGSEDVVFFGLQAFVLDYLIESFDEWFDDDVEDVVAEYQRRLDNLLGPNPIGTDHIRALHNLGYLPIRIRAVKEGTKVPLRVPMLTIENTHPDFYWLTNFLETVLSNYLWMPITSATTANMYRRVLDEWARRTGDESFVQFQAHDFSMRGMTSVQSAAMSGAAHLLSFVGTDSLPAIELLENFYHPAPGEMVGVSVAATEHSVMCAGGQETEDATFARLMDDHPTGILSVVSDTWDLWSVLRNILPAAKDQIMARDGKLVIRPDSGDPVDIICGNPNAPFGSDAYKGVVEILWEEFGGTTNEKGFKVLDEHVGVIYGDAITLDRADAICARLAGKGFATTNIVLGVGSFTYQHVTRDTYGMAVKSTWVQINGEGHAIFKDPVTDSGLKKSATGRLAVRQGSKGLELVENATEEDEENSLLELVYEDGGLMRIQSLSDIRALATS